MDAVWRAVLELFWNSAEQRPRALHRIGATAFLASLAAVLLAVIGNITGSAVDSGGGALGALGRSGLLVVFLFLFFGIVVLVDRRYLGDLGIQPTRRWFGEFGAGVVIGVCMTCLVVAVSLLGGFMSVEGTLVVREGGILTGLSPVGTVVLGWLFLFLLATVEEIVFRGYLLVNIAEGLRGITDDRTAVLASAGITSLLFGIVHGLNPGVSLLSLLNITLFGLLLGAAYVLTGQLAVPVGIHVAWNYTLGVVFGLPVSGLRTERALIGLRPSGPSILTGGTFGPEGGVVLLLGLCVGGALLAGWLQYSKEGIDVSERIVQPDLWTLN